MSSLQDENSDDNNECETWFLHGISNEGLIFSNSTRRRVPTSAEVIGKLGDDDDDNYGVSKVTRKKKPRL
jgi:hypothetical protein